MPDEATAHSSKSNRSKKTYISIIEYKSLKDNFNKDENEDSNGSEETRNVYKESDLRQVQFWEFCYFF
jgi:hypothetical protein